MAVFQRGLKENLIKHTPGGELPDASKRGEMARRVSADAALLSDEAIAISLLGLVLTTAATVGLGFGLYRAIKSRAE